MSYDEHDPTGEATAMDPDPAETGYIALPAGTPGLDEDGDPPCPEAMIAEIRNGTAPPGLMAGLIDYDDTDPAVFGAGEMHTALAAVALRKLRADEAEIDRCKLLAAAEFARIDEWLISATAARRSSVQRLREALMGYHRVVLERDPHAKTIRFPHGTLLARQGQPRWSVDPGPFVAWAEQTGREDELLRYRPAPLLGMIKAALAPGALLPGADGQVVSPDGQPVPGLTCEPGQVSYRVELEAVDHG